MKSDINGCSTCQAGTESYETFRCRGIKRYQYDFRAEAGGLFACMDGETKALIWAVIRSYFDDGMVNVAVLPVPAEENIGRSHVTYPDRDVWVDVFVTEQTARNFARNISSAK